MGVGGGGFGGGGSGDRVMGEGGKGEGCEGMRGVGVGRAGRQQSCIRVRRAISCPTCARCKMDLLLGNNLLDGG